VVESRTVLESTSRMLLEDVFAMRLSVLLLVLALIQVSSSSFAAVKAYNSDPNNGTPSDGFLHTLNLCPPVRTTLGEYGGWAILDDDGAGSVSLNVLASRNSSVVFTPEVFEPIFGPGAFIFIDRRETRHNVPPGGMVHPSSPGSGTDPGEQAVWGIVSGWSMSGAGYCISSPITVCNQADFVHGTTVPSLQDSGTYNLGTWVFDSVGDYAATYPYIFQISNGGQTNNSLHLRGALHGSAIPALPLVGFGALALSLAVIGARSMMGKK
jgi:hypothetical protein